MISWYVRGMEKTLKIIYDFGMNNGDDVAYYLTKADLVVAVEANTALCKGAECRFADEIAAGRLVILNVALSEKTSDVAQPFYVHRANHVLSQLRRPAPEDLHLFDEVLVPQMTADSITDRFGEPHYVKIDIEGCDEVVLKSFLNSGTFPDFISAECHSAEVFCLICAMGYRSFNLVDGATVEKYGFSAHSAGPYGADILSPWYDLQSFFYLLAWERLGWKDIHASKVIECQVTTPPSRTMGPSEHLRDFVPSLKRAIRLRLAKSGGKV